MRGDQRDRGRGLVHLTALDADQPVLDHVDAADAVRAGALIQATISWYGDIATPSSATGTPPANVMTTVSGSIAADGDWV